MTYEVTFTVSIDEVLNKMSQGELEGLARDLVDQGYGRYVDVDKATTSAKRWEEFEQRYPFAL